MTRTGKPWPSSFAHWVGIVLIVLACVVIFAGIAWVALTSGRRFPL